MLKFAIVDDDQKTLKRVEDFARAYMQNVNDSFQIKSFTKSINLISSILDGRGDARFQRDRDSGSHPQASTCIGDYLSHLLSAVRAQGISGPCAAVHPEGEDGGRTTGSPWESAREPGGDGPLLPDGHPLRKRDPGPA